MSNNEPVLIGSDGVRWTIEMAEWMRTQAREFWTAQQSAIALCNTALSIDPNDATALGVKRTFYPMRHCATCGEVDDFVGTGQACGCWTEVTPEDVERLRDQGVDIELRDEGDAE